MTDSAGSRTDPPADDEGTSDTAPSERQVPVGEPVVRADPAVTGDHAREAVGFDPNDPESLAEAAETVQRFADADASQDDNVVMLRGAAACAALVRGEGSYRAASDRTDGAAPVSFIRKWARVHDLPQSVRRHVARGDIAPTAAKHIARVDGAARFDLAWAVLDHDLTVREIRSLASEVNEGADPVEALRAAGVDDGALALSLPPEAYRELRRQASLSNREPGEVVAEALTEYFDRQG